MPGAFLDVGCPWSLLPAAPMTGDLVGLHSGECWTLRESGSQPQGREPWAVGLPGGGLGYPAQGGEGGLRVSKATGRESSPRSPNGSQTCLGVRGEPVLTVTERRGWGGRDTPRRLSGFRTCWVGFSQPPAVSRPAAGHQGALTPDPRSGEGPEAAGAARGKAGRGRREPGHGGRGSAGLGGVTPPSAPCPDITAPSITNPTIPNHRLHQRLQP